MPDVKKVISAIKKITDRYVLCDCCTFDDTGVCLTKTVADVLTLMEERLPAEATIDGDGVSTCEACGWTLSCGCNYCEHCGRPLIWNYIKR